MDGNQLNPAPWWDGGHRLNDEERAAALDECHRQITEWGLTMPDVEPVVLNFGSDDFRQRGLIIFSIVNEVSAGYCGKFLFVLDGQTCPYHHHGVKHETFFIVKGRALMTIDGQERVMAAGDALAMEPGVEHSFTGLGNALLLEVSMPSSGGDNFFEDKSVGREGVV